MNRRIKGPIITIWALALLSSAVSHADVSVSRIEYHGWKGAYRMTNGTVDLVFVPQIGRIMRYGYVGKPNVLWENPELFGKTVDLKNPPKDWTNFGGDKLWPAPQDRWGWPPDPVIDASPQSVVLLQSVIPSDKLLRAIGRPSKNHGIRFERFIALGSSGTDVAITNRMVNTSKASVKWAIWEVAQVDDPSVAILPLYKLSGFPPIGYILFPTSPPVKTSYEVRGEDLFFHRDSKKGGKIGGAPGGSISAQTHGFTFEVSVDRHYVDNRSWRYADHNCGREIWSNPDPLKYMELELLSPVHSLKPGEHVDYSTNWRLSVVTRAK